MNTISERQKYLASEERDGTDLEEGQPIRS